MTALPVLPVMNQMVIVFGIPGIGMADRNPEVESQLVLLGSRLKRPLHKRSDGHPVPVKILKGLNVQRRIPIGHPISMVQPRCQHQMRVRMR